MIAALAAAVFVYQATVVRVSDGDSLVVRVDGFPAPFDPVAVRVDDIDTPETRMPPAKSRCEAALGKQASAYARGLVRPGETVTVIYTLGKDDKYRRLLADVTLPDGRDWAEAMIEAGHARPYGGAHGLTKRPWC